MRVCKGKAGVIDGLVPIILQARPVRWLSLRLCTAYSARAGLICHPNAGAHTRGPGALKPSSSGLPQV